MSHELDKVLQKIQRLSKQTDDYITKLEYVIHEEQRQAEYNIISYFSYSERIVHQPDVEGLLIGSLHILNIGRKSISNPYICIQLSEESPFHFSGKFLQGNTSYPIPTGDTWERFDDVKNPREYWLRPVHQNVLKPNEKVSFSPFQLKWLPSANYSGIVSSFTYFHEVSEGIPVLNPISISGTITKGGGFHES
ncbi:hypothetical protein WAK64_08495 [Bacillus spongiae]|uniref:Uncharacterized protein n=1 Tax=Bacillus spongiae TaxID=2683610 RepID=A0ABU8HD23_9BACI